MSGRPFFAYLTNSSSSSKLFRTRCAVSSPSVDSEWDLSAMRSFTDHFSTLFSQTLHYPTAIAAWRLN
jgi:hypothetical protein